MKIFTTLCMTLLGLTLIAQNGLDFDGSNDYVQMTNGGPTGSANRTVECWIKTSTSQQSQQVILDWGAALPLGSRFTLNILAFGKLRIEVGGNGFNSTQSVADGNWHHVAVSYDNAATTKVKMYIDGSLETSSNFTVAVNTSSSGGLLLGRRIDGINYFDGIIDEVRIWNTVRSLADISSSKNGEFCGVPTGLVAYYKCNQGTAGGTNTGQTTLTNSTGSNNGTLTNFSLTGNSSNWVAGKTLTIGSGGSSTISVSACDSYTSPSGKYTWTQNGQYIDTVSSSLGCDSILTINLTLNSSNTGSMSVTGCNSYTSPSGKYVWSTPGTYKDTITNINGCDSVLTINLTLNTIDTNVLQNGATLTSWATGANYQWLDCNNGFASIAGATGQTFTPTANGSYAVEVSDVNCVDTSACYLITSVSLSEFSFSEQVKVYPNPVKENAHINLGSIYNWVGIKIVDVTGKVVMKKTAINANNFNLPISLSSGIYFIKISADGFNTIKRISIL